MTRETPLSVRHHACAMGRRDPTGVDFHRCMTSKLIAKGLLDELGIDYVEGGYPRRQIPNRYRILLPKGLIWLMPASRRSA